MNPTRRCLLNILNKCGQYVSRLQSNQKMNVIGYATNTFGNSLRGADQPSEVFVESKAPIIGNLWPALFRAEYDMVMQT